MKRPGGPSILSPFHGGKPGPGQALGLFAGSRLALVLLSFLAVFAFPVNTRNRESNLALIVNGADRSDRPRSAWAEPAAVEVWARWDALWYARIAEHGYRAFPEFEPNDPEHREPPSTGFYPLLPLLMRALGFVTGSPLRAGLLVANLALLLSVLVLHRLSARLAGAEAALPACAVLLLYPTSVFLSAPYAESLGLLFSLLAAWWALDRRFWAAGGAGFLAALSRPTGVLLCVLLGLEWIRARREDARSAPVHAALAMLLPAAGLGAFLAWCGLAFGTPLAPIHRQDWWRGGGLLDWPPGVWLDLVEPETIYLLGFRSSWIEIGSAVLFLVFGVLAFRRVPISIAVYGLLATLLPLTSSLISFSRIALASFPALIAAGAFLGRRPGLARAAESFLALLLGVFAVLYFTWNWVG